MQDQSPKRQIPIGIVAGVSVFLLTTGSAVAWWMTKQAPPDAAQTTQRSEPTAPPPAPLSPQPLTSPTAPKQKLNPADPSSAEKEPEVYWVKPSEKAIALAPSPVPAKNPNSALEEAMQQLLAGPANPTETTTIPTGTKLRSVTQKADGIHIDLSNEFKSGGGTTSMTGRVGQIIYTATSVDPKAAVWISVEGQPLETLGGEGLVLEQPMTRDRFKQDFPSQQ
jgi:spore germination protein GerM